MKKIFLIFFLLGVLSGCGGKIFLADRPRVDQELPGVSPENDHRAKTRKVLVFQWTQDQESSPAEESTSSEATIAVEDSVNTKQTSTVDLPLPMGIEPAGLHLSSEEFQIYQVQKDDTLQKISKKFYGSFEQWPKIYEYNRDTMADPHRLKPGQKIKIPQYH